MKNIINNLIKVANNLDSLGYMEEANIVDRVAKKIIVSQYTKIDHNKAKEIGMTGVYMTDITNYKNLVYSAYRDKDGKFQSKPCREHLMYANNLLKAVQEDLNENYDALEKKAFEIQADRILHDVKGNWTDINIAYTSPDSSKPLNHYLVKYRITDSGGSLLPEITNINELRKRFMKMKNDSDIIDATPEYYYTKQLGDTYNLLALKFK